MKNNFVFITVLFLGLVSFRTNAQIIEMPIRDTSSVIIDRKFQEKTSVFIFIKEYSGNHETIRLKSTLELVDDLGWIDTSSFEVYLMRNLDTFAVCSIRPKKLKIHGHELHPTFKYEPYYILIHPKSSAYNIFPTDTSARMKKPYTKALNREDRSTELLQCNDWSHLLNVIRGSDYKSVDAQINSKIAQLNMKLNALQGELFKANNTNARELKDGRTLLLFSRGSYELGSLAIFSSGEIASDGTYEAKASGKRYHVKEAKVIKVTLKETFQSDKGQIVIECQDMMRPVVGDPVYKDGSAAPDGVYRLGFMYRIRVSNGKVAIR